ncbi:MAG: DNA repair protein RecO [Acidobacteriaceae bacterium]
MIQHVGEALVLRTWPFQEADLLVSLFTREQGRVKGVARHAMRSRRRFGGALEPMTHVRATWVEKPRQELVRLDAFEILSSPLSRAIDYTRTAALELLAEVLDELPEGAVEDAVFRLSLAVLDELQIGRVSLPITYFCLWMNRLMGWMPELGHCAACGLALDGNPVWYSELADGVFCADDRRPASYQLAPASVQMTRRIFREQLKALAAEPWAGTFHQHSTDLQRFAIEVLERHLEGRLRSARPLTGR